MNMTIVKNRNGIIGRSYRFHINYNTLRISDYQTEVADEGGTDLADAVFENITL